MFCKKFCINFLFLRCYFFFFTFPEFGYDDCVKVHVLPREMLGRSTFGLSMWLLKWFPMWLVDRFLLLMSRLMRGDTAQLGLTRPNLGPLQLKKESGKTPVLDIGTLEKIRSGHIKVSQKVLKWFVNYLFITKWFESYGHSCLNFYA